MTNIILPANTLSEDELTVPNALNFMGVSDSARFQRTNSASGSSTQATLSAWIKYQGDISQSVPIFMAPDASGSNRFYINIASSEEMGGTFRDPDCDFSSTNDNKLRDPSAWYHIVAAINTNDGTAADRLKIWVNNQRIVLTFATGGGLGSAANIHFNTSGYKNIFGYNDVTNDGVGSLTDMYFSEVIKCDGQVLAPTDFAEYDSDTGIWVPKTGLEDTLTFGTTGYYYNFEDSDALGNDVSGNSNDASDISNTSQSLDTPSNNFATLNSINSTLTNTVISEGNLKLVGGRQSVNYTFITGTIAPSSGKWYWEVKAVDNSEIDQVGVAKSDLAQFSNIDNSGGLYATTYGGKGVQMSNGNKVGDGAQSAYMGGFSANDICMIALDLDNTKITFGRNGQWSNGSGGADQAYGAATAAYTNLTAGALYVPAQCMRDSGASNPGTMEYNFGNPLFAISSGNADGNGYGNFEYAPPSGFLALCTKNLSTENS